MFEPTEKSRSKNFWKVLICSFVLFAGVVAVLVFFLTPGAQGKTELTAVLRPGNSNYEWYNRYVSLKNPQIQMGKNIAGQRIVMFSAVIQNQGEKMLDVVEIEIKFYNYEELVWKTIRTPIRPERGNYTPAIEPLEERGFAVYIENIPEGWLASHAEMDMHGFRFVSHP